MTGLTTETNWLTGWDQSQLQLVENQQWLHKSVVPAYLRLQQSAELAGLQIRLVSGWRSFQRQAVIWQQKCNGQRAVYDLSQRAVDISQLAGRDKLNAILLYSALPGASRHHWGTDFDIYDAAAVSPSYQVQLTQAEYHADGPFYKLHCWLQEYLQQFDFFRPYQRYQGGVAAEPWHLSYRPLAATAMSKLTQSLLQQVIMQNPIAEQTAVLAALPDIYQQYIINICEDER